MNIGLSAIMAFLASLTRGYLMPLIFAVVVLMLVSFVGAIGLGSFYPWAIPGAFAMAGVKGGNPGTIGAIIVIALSIAGVVATSLYWRYADQK
jgi:ABC-2 type transport system permease protein